MFKKISTKIWGWIVRWAPSGALFQALSVRYTALDFLVVVGRSVGSDTVLEFAVSDALDAFQQHLEAGKPLSDIQFDPEGLARVAERFSLDGEATHQFVTSVLSSLDELKSAAVVLALAKDKRPKQRICMTWLGMER